MDFSQVKIVGGAAIVAVRDTLIWITQFATNHITLLANSSGFTNSVFWSAVYPKIQIIGAFVAPILSKLGNFLITGYGTGILLSIYLVLSAIKLWKTEEKCSLGFIFHAAVTVAVLALTIVAFTYGSAVIV